MLRLVIQGRVDPVDLDNGRITVGRHRSNTVVLAGRDVSGFHAEISCGEKGAYLADLDSTNGTKVNGKTLTKPRRLRAKDVVAFGSTEAQVVDTKVDGAVPRLPVVRLAVRSGMPSAFFVPGNDKVVVGRAPAWAWACLAVIGVAAVALSLLLLTRDRATGTPSGWVSAGGDGAISGTAASGGADEEELRDSGSSAARGFVPGFDASAPEEPVPEEADGRVGRRRGIPARLVGSVAAVGANDGPVWPASARGIICLERDAKARDWFSILSRRGQSSSLLELHGRRGDPEDLYVRSQGVVAVIMARDCPSPFVAVAPTRRSGFSVDFNDRLPTGITYAHGLFYVTYHSDERVYAYGGDGKRNPAADFMLASSPESITKITYGNGRFYVLVVGEKNRAVVHAYNRSGHLDGRFDVGYGVRGMTFADDRLHVLVADSVDSSLVRVYSSRGEWLRVADFRLDGGDATDMAGIAYARGLFYVTERDFSDDKVYVYGSRGERVPATDLAKHSDNRSSRGITYAEGCFFVVDSHDRWVYAYGDGGAGQDGTPGGCLR